MFQPPRNSCDRITVLAISALVYTLAKVTHEGLGHGAICVLVGGALKGISSSWCDCAIDPASPWAGRAEHAAGTLANLAVAGVSLLLLRYRPPQTGAVRYFVWLTFVVNALMGSGYLMVDPIFGFGDWAAFLVGLDARWLLKLLLAGLGLLLTLLAFRRGGRELIPFVGTSPPTALPLARMLCWIPWGLAGGLLLTGAAALNHFGAKYAFTSALASLGGTWMLVWIPSPFRRARPEIVGPSLAIDRSPGFIAAGMAATAFLLTLFGPGIISG
jgi:hypothetical protein